MMRLRSRLAAATLSATLLPLVGCSTGYPSYDIPGISFDAPRSEGLESVAFLSGCWRGGQTNGPLAEEHFSLGVAGTMMGWSRTTRGGRTGSWEFIRIVDEVDDIVYQVWPGGERSPARFALTDVVEGAQATFEAPEHDFPRRIRYQLIQPGLMQITVDGGADADPSGDVLQLTMRQVSCDSG